MNIDEIEYLSHHEKVYLSDYDINWETQFINEKILLQSCFPDIFIEHIGSTSVKGMAAKPIIDIMLGVVSYPPSNEMIRKLEESGYIYLGEHGEQDKTDKRISLSKRGGVNFNIHFMQYLGKSWNNNILFRDYLRKNQNAVSEYSRIKQDIINRGIDDTLIYSNEKSGFISNILDKAQKEQCNKILT